MLTLHDQHSAPAESRTTLAAVEEANGFIPNLFRGLANSPSTLNAFYGFVGENDEGSLSPAERQIVQLTASVENAGGYCVSGHTAFAKNIGLADDVIESLRNGEMLANSRYQALADMTRALMRTRGKITSEQIEAFQEAGYRQEQILEVIAGIAMKTITNYVSGAFSISLDPEFQPFAWTKKLPPAA